MKNNTILVIGLGAVLALGSIGFNWVEVILPTAEAHGVQAQLQSRFVKIQNEVFNGQSFATGEQLCLEGELQSLVERDLRAWVSIFSESTNAGYDNIYDNFRWFTYIWLYCFISDEVVITL